MTTRSTSRSPWRVVTTRELADLWLSPRGLTVLFGFTLLLSLLAYLAAADAGVNLLDARESVGVPGRFSLYTVVLRPAGSELTASNVAIIDVEDRRSLDPDGILPVAMGVPIVVGGLLMGQIGYRRRSWRDD